MSLYSSQWPAWLFRVVGAISLMLLIGADGPKRETKAPTAEQSARNFTTGGHLARTFGVYEVVLRGRGAVANPFATHATVTFTPPSSDAHPVTVQAFYDGGDTWRARVYVTESGRWKWTAKSTDDALLDGHRGWFIAANSPLRGMLRKDNRNPKQWMTDDGHWFLNISDTAYLLFSPYHGFWKAYVRDDVAHGITSVRGDWANRGWKDYWIDSHRTKFNLSHFHTVDARLQWILDHYPYLYIQLKLFPGPPWGTDDQYWHRLPVSVRRATMRYLIARLAAYPNLFFEVTNDTFCTRRFPHNRAMVREVGSYFKTHDPWSHLISFGPNRNQPFCFLDPEDDWVTYIAIEGAWSLSADQARLYKNRPLHVFLEEDYYEDARPHFAPAHPRYFYRRLFWAWLLSGGSANYGGRWATLDPYSQTGKLTYREPRSGHIYRNGLVGLNSIPVLKQFFADREIELWRFEPDDGIAASPDGRSGCRRIKATHRGSIEYLLYAPDAASCGAAAALGATRAPRLLINLTESHGRYHVEWFRTVDGQTKEGRDVKGGRILQLTSPWRGQDVVLRLKQISAK